MKKVYAAFVAAVVWTVYATAPRAAQQQSSAGSAVQAPAATNSASTTQNQAPAPAPGNPAATPQNPATPDNTTTQRNGVPTIRVPVNLVNVLFTVTDKKDRLVLDLSKDDFRVLEDSKPQQIRFFGRESSLPLRVAVLIDTSNSIRERLHFEEEAAIDFLDEIIRSGTDQAFAVGFDVQPQLLVDYTDDTDKLGEAIRNLQAGGGTGMYDAIYYACKEKMSNFPPTDPYLRRVMILVSDGLDNESQHTRDEALSMAQHAEVTVYAVSTNRSGMTYGKGDKVLRYLAEQTGGRAFFPLQAQELAATFHEIGRELRSQYSLAYVSTNTAHDGSFRSISLQPLDKGLRVLAKAGYFAPSQ
jgi:VWFA-related protein